MDTKWKNIDESKEQEKQVQKKERLLVPFLSWFSLIGGLSLLAGICLLFLINADWQEFLDTFQTDVYLTEQFASETNTLLQSACEQFDRLDKVMLPESESQEYPKIKENCVLEDRFEDASPKILYYNPQNQYAYSTDNVGSELRLDTAYNLFETYHVQASESNASSLIFFYDGSNMFRYVKDGTEQEPGSLYYNALLDSVARKGRYGTYHAIFDGAENGILLFYVEVDDIYSYVNIERQWTKLRIAYHAMIICAIVSVVFILIGLFARKSRKQFVERIMQTTGSFYSEVKLIAAFIAFALFMLSGEELGWRGFPEGLFMYALFFASYWCLWYFLMDLIVHRKTYLRHTAIVSMIGSIWKYTSRLAQGKPFKKQMMIKLIVFLLIECFFAFVIAMLMAMGGGYCFSLAFFLSLFSIALAVAYAVLFERTLHDYSAVLDQIAAMHRGTASAPLVLKETSVLYPTAVQLGDLQSGMNRTMEHMLRSERMKIELITNVSHDLKTPLTSIISYINLLANMELMPEEANDYVKVVSQKAQRLHRMTNDLFDISKVESGNMNLNREQIDMADHLRQTLAELGEKIENSNLDFKISIPSESVTIYADGEKLYRIFENLIVNALKYSMEHTRVYLRIMILDKEAAFEIKNIASYEMQFDADEITARFTRGDESRTEEGSGLGLAICKSFAQSLGGKFKVELDGDLFKATVTFPLYYELTDQQ